MSRRDEGLDRLLDLDGFIAEVGGGYWVKIVAQHAPPEEYAYRDAETLMVDFWREVEAFLKKEGVE